MKVIFLDFDGVLNSTQEVYQKINRREKSWYWRNRERFANWLCFRYKQVKLAGGGYQLKIRKDPFKILEWFTDFSRNHVADHAEFCPMACSNVQYILKNNPDVKVVVSSVWRTDGVKRLKQIFKRNGINPDVIIDVTPHKGPEGQPARGRGDQIQAWLEGCRNVLNPETQNYVTHFAIVDDDGDMCDLMDSLIQTDGNEGFMWHDAMKVIKMLEGKGEARCG